MKQIEDEKWNEEETQRLLDAIEKYCPNNWDEAFNNWDNILNYVNNTNNNSGANTGTSK